MLIKDKIINAIQSGNSVTYLGYPVTMEGTYSWQVKNLWINLNNGATYKAGYKEIKVMQIN